MQKKEFEFKNRKHRIGGDISISDEIILAGKKYIVFVNGDAMGKSLQGAGGSLVFGSVFQSILTQTREMNTDTVQPKFWLVDTVKKMQAIFESFDCSMLISVAMGLVEENTGLMFYLNAEHPWAVLYRDGKASYIENEETMAMKIGFPNTFMSENPFYVRKFKFKNSDVILLGSDGRDDIDESFGLESSINSDPVCFLKSVEKGKGNLRKIIRSISERGNFIDDVSLIRIEYKKPVKTKKKNRNIRNS